MAESELITLDLKSYLPKEQPQLFDLKEYLFKGLILKEKDYREALSNIDWDQYKDKEVLVFCSEDVIIPVWAYMLAATYLKPIAKSLFFDHLENWKEKSLLSAIQKIELTQYHDKRIVIKGCGEETIPESAYFEITTKLLPVVKSLMYGEPCSTVPIYKKK